MEYIEFSDLNIGHNIVIHFYPYSQTYINILKPKIGTVCSIGSSYQDYKIIPWTKVDNGSESDQYEDSDHYEDSNQYEYLNQFIDPSKYIKPSDINTNENLFYPSVSYYGNDLGYEFSIKIII
jgi:hypothetical protein